MKDWRSGQYDIVAVESGNQAALGFLVVGFQLQKDFDRGGLGRASTADTGRSPPKLRAYTRKAQPSYTEVQSRTVDNPLN